MVDLRTQQPIDLSGATELKANTTFLYQNHEFGKKLVAKRIGDYDDQNDAMLVAEFRKLALLSAEPNIGTVYFMSKATKNSETFSCYFMEHIEGISFGEFINSKEQLSYQEALNLLLQVVSGLESSHRYSIFHNDLHEGNLIVDDTGQVKIIDFLWREIGKSNQEKLATDIKQFQFIFNKIKEKIPIEDKERFGLVERYISSISSFVGTKKSIEALDEVSFVLSLLGDNSKNILSKILIGIGNTFKLSMVSSRRNIPLPEKFAKLDVEPGPIIDMRKMKADRAIRHHFKLHFSELERAGLCKLDIGLETPKDDERTPPHKKASDHGGPYFYRYSISLTPRAIELFILNKTHNFLPQPLPEELHEFVATVENFFQ